MTAMWLSFPVIFTEIGEIFGVSYIAVSHIVNKVKVQLEANRGYGEEYKLINSQIKM